MTIRQTLHIAMWASEECERQQSGERSVGWMVKGWVHAHRRRNDFPNEGDIRMLGFLVEPRKAAGGYRQVNVRVGWDVKGAWQDVPRQMRQLVEALTDPDATIHPDEWYRQYEEIHPFADGNGRTGSILWNWLRGSLDEPEAPPDFWSVPVLVHEEAR